MTQYLPRLLLWHYTQFDNSTLVPIAQGLIHLWLESATCYTMNLHILTETCKMPPKRESERERERESIFMAPLWFAQPIFHLLASLVILINHDVGHVATYHRVPLPQICVCVSICMYIYIYIYGQLGCQCAIYTGENHQIYSTMLEMLIHL